jgi:DNA invertase Pin-like site-specific DNA recombinase
MANPILQTHYAHPAPDPVDRDYIRDLIFAAGISQLEAARRLRICPTTLRRWLTYAKTHSTAPWHAVELLRRMLLDG